MNELKDIGMKFMEQNIIYFYIKMFCREIQADILRVAGNRKIQATGRPVFHAKTSNRLFIISHNVSSGFDFLGIFTVFSSNLASLLHSTVRNK